VPWNANGLPLGVLAVAPEIAALVTPDLTPLFVNPAFVACWDAYPDEPTDLFHVHPEDRPRLQSVASTALNESSRTISMEARLGTDESWAPALLRVAAVPDTAETLVIHALDPTSGTAPHGWTTSWDNELGLPGRSCLLQRLDQIDRGNLVLCDLDNFHLVNDSLGHQVGNVVLAALARRFRLAIHEGDLLSWLGADEFAVVCEHPDEDPRALADRLRRTAHKPVRVSSGEYVITASFGIAHAAAGTTTLDALAAADAALFLAKERGRDRIEMFDDGLLLTAITTLKRTSELRQAASRGELGLHFQPIVDLGTNAMLGCEALLRWDHPAEGVLAAGSFLPMAETSGLINELTPYLLREAVTAARTLRDSSPRPPFVAVNISAAQLVHPALARYVEDVLDEAQLPASLLVIEITETTVLTDLDGAQRTLNWFREQGIGVALDDFGTGYSSLLNLRRLPVTKLKIDKGFVRGCLHDQDDLAIVASVVDLAAKLGVECIAEGVETLQQAVLLHELGCRAGQGFLWSPAVPISELTAALSARRPSLSTEVAADSATTMLILRMHERGSSLSAIAAALNAHVGQQERGRGWSPEAVAQVIATTHYPRLTQRQAADPQGS
jgi:diguanylate cyclase (GGDEF)-like protein